MNTAIAGRSPPTAPGLQDGLSDALTIDALRARGAHRFDPVRFRFIEALARRTAAHGGQARQMLDRRLAEVLAEYAARADQARTDGDRDFGALMARFPDAADGLRRLHADGDLRGLRHLVDRLEALDEQRPLADLVRYIDRQAVANDPASTEPSAPAAAAAPIELRALRLFRNTWTRIGVDRQLRRSLRAVPENPGPLNSQLLVLRALQQMQDTSPAYLDRFMSHVQALLWLDQARLGAAPPPVKAVRRDGANKRRSGRPGAG